MKEFSIITPKRTFVLRIKYPKLILLLLTFVFAYFIFRNNSFQQFHRVIISAGYLGTFLSGVFFAYGFTAAPATAILLILSKEQNIIAAGLIAGLGALIGDLIIFNLIRSSFADEMQELSQERIISLLSRKGGVFSKYILMVVGGFVIASPLPDEIGVYLFAASMSVSQKVFSIFSFVLNTAGILVILLIGNSL
ncbi:MAG: hypothetical protein NTV63_03300 [Candidatus Woesearchaeota archaeon]|nr:hypothetical protein [Candidatus Woesearchaeota archaeon]